MMSWLTSDPRNPMRPNDPKRPTRSLAWLLPAIAIACGGCGGDRSHDAPTTPGRDPLIVYCAHDSFYSEAILEGFRRETGIEVLVKYDTEATKSLGLVNLLIEEKNHPRCDVFWNNQVLGTVDLVEHGLLAPYRGPGWRRIPEAYKDADGHWTGFAARLRVWIVNTDRIEATERAIEQAQRGDLSRMAIARPLFGTTLSHYCLLWHTHGAEALKTWHHDTRDRGLIEAAGNATVRNLVASGTCDLGWTDTDDYFVAIDDNRPVAMLPMRLDDGHTIAIPNSVAIIRGTPRISQSRRLVDFLLSAETELSLAKSASRQVPLGPVDESQLPGEVRQLAGWAAEGVSLVGLERSRAACLAWLKSEYAR